MPVCSSFRVAPRTLAVIFNAIYIPSYSILAHDSRRLPAVNRILDRPLRPVKSVLDSPIGPDGTLGCLVNLLCVQQCYKFLYCPDVIRKPRFHCGSHAQRFVNPAKVVVHEMQRDRMSVVLYLLRESIGEPREPAH